MSLPIAQRWSDRTWLVEYALPPIICLALSLLIVSTASTLTLQSGFLDPYVYAGYVNDYFGTFQRYGHTYYSSRIAYILLDRAFLLAFGQDTGIFLCRLAVLTSATYATFRIAQRYFGFSVAILSISWLCFIPWLLRSISWTHYDGFATVYFLIALAFVLVPERHRFLGHAAAGFFLALAVNCNLHLLMVAGLFAPSWLWLNRKNGPYRLLGLTLAISLGFVAGYAMLQVLFWRVTGGSRVFIEAAAFNSARDLLGGQMSNWFHSLASNIATGKLIFLLPVFFSGAIILTVALNWLNLKGAQRDFCVAAALYIILLTVGVFILHSLGHGWLSLFYYQIYQLPSCLLVLISAAGITATRAPVLFRFICFGSIAAFASIWFARHTISAALPDNDIWIWIALAAATMGLALVRPRTSSAPALLVGLLLATNLMFVWQYRVAVRHYSLWPGLRSEAEVERSVYSGAVFLQKFVRAHVPPSASVGFWYSNSPENVNLSSMQSMFLWGYSRVQGFTGPGMPLIDEAVRRSVQQRPFIGVIARSDTEMDAAYTALRTIPTDFVEVARAAYSAPAESYVVGIAELAPVAPPIGARLGELKLDSIVSENGGTVRIGPSGLDLSSPACQWCYSASVSLASEPDEQQNAVLRVKLNVSGGQIGIGIASTENMSSLQNIISVGTRALGQIVDIELPSPSRNAVLIVRNESPHGVSHATIKSIEYHRKN